MKIFTANFPFELTETGICELFKIFGAITGCKLVTDPDTGKGKGFGFIEFREESQAKLAIKKIHGVRIAGRVVAVTLSTSENTQTYRKKNPRLKNTG